ncbi:MAG: translesion error-prone DNA polymerase V autoproteolytic subunit [Thermoguttaceae bacterium]|nr:translesion error-prone DNA polymerase V autoproteolytic subunit [Thermoguttaceae bacterium]
MLDKILHFVEQKGLTFPFYAENVQAGYPSPSEDVPEERLDLGDYLIKNPASTFIVKVAGESMKDAGIYQDDLLIVDRSLQAENGNVVVAYVNGEFTVKRLFKTKKKVELRPENKNFKPIVFENESEMKIWGVVKSVIHNV